MLDINFVARIIMALKACNYQKIVNKIIHVDYELREIKEIFKSLQSSLV